MRNEDVSLPDACIRLKDSKNGKERMIPLSDSLKSVCEEYVSRKALMPFKSTGEDFFFVNLQGRPCTWGGVHSCFQKILRHASIPKHHHGPRIHDLRHTFAVHSLAQMVEAGIDLYCSLPILSTFLGHGSLRATDAYVRLTAEMYPALLKDVDLVCLNVFPPKSDIHEAD